MKTTAPTSSSLDPLPRLGGRYALRERLGRGGAGEVWSATDALTGDTVAVKLLRPQSGHAHARIRREVAALRLLRIPGVVRLLDEGIEAGWVYLVMEFVQGRPFPGSDAPLDWSALEPMTLALLDTLGRIHAAGVVHRDLKPENVLVTSAGVPVVLDFGIARAPVGEDLTSDGEFIGTPIYTAPESAQGEVCTPRSDFFSLGVMLFEALSGELPYPSGNRMQALFSRVINPARSLAEAVPHAPERLVSALATLLQRDPALRPATATAAKALLRGERWDGDALRLPWVGPTTAVDLVVAAGMARRRIDIVGASGTGRTHTLHAAAERLLAAGVSLHWLHPSERAFGSLGSLRPELGGAGESAASAMDAVRARLGSFLAAGGALLADDAERLDAATRKVLAMSPEGAIVRALLPTASTPYDVARLGPWTAASLEALFGGPERVLHARSDAARLLHQRSAGVASRVIAELRVWIQGAWATQRDGCFEVSREAMDHLSTAPRLRAPGSRSGPPTDLSAAERDLLSGVSVAWPDGTPTVLARVLRRPEWEVELDARNLEERGLVRVTADRYEPLLDLWCDWSDDRLASAHRIIASALEPGAERRLMHLIAGADHDAAREVSAEALARAERLARVGALGDAIQVLEEGVRAVRRVAPEDLAECGVLLRAWTEYALLQESAGGLDRALYALCRDPAPPGAAAWGALVRAALTGLTDGARALLMADEIGVMDDPNLERRRHAVRVFAARSTPVEREREVVLDAVSRLAGRDDPRDRSCAAGWLGRLRYREGRFDEAAALQEQAAALEPWAGLRVIALSRAASARMEGFRFDDALRLARETRALAARCRNVHYEALAEWVLRTVSYRMGDVQEVDEALIDGVRQMGVRHIEALVCFTEAAVAWRGGELGRARALAGTAHDNWSALGLRAQAMLARCLAIASGAAVSVEECDALCAQASACGIAGVGVQALALLDATTVDRASLASLASQVPRAHWSTRIDVLSVAESLSRLRVAEDELGAGEAVAPQRPSLMTTRG